MMRPWNFYLFISLLSLLLFFFFLNLGSTRELLIGTIIGGCMCWKLGLTGLVEEYEFHTNTLFFLPFFFISL